MGRMWAKWAFLNSPMEPGEYEKVMAVHSFFPAPGSNKKGAWEGIKKQNGARWYILKYATKYKQKEVPSTFKHPGRFWGKSKDVKPGEGIEIDVSEVEVREYLLSKTLNVAKAPILPKEIIIPK